MWIAEQAAILSEIAKSKNDPPWLTPKPSESGGPPIGGKSSGATVLRMTTNEQTFSKVASPPPSDFKTAAPRPFKRQADAPVAGEELPDFKRKAVPPPQGVLPEPIKVPQRPPPPRPGTGASANSLGAREKEDLDRFAKSGRRDLRGLGSRWHSHGSEEVRAHQPRGLTKRSFCFTPHRTEHQPVCGMCE